MMNSQVQENIQNILNKLGAIDSILISLTKLHKDNEKEAEDIFKQYSLRKVILIKEAYTLLSNLTIGVH